MLLMVKRYQMWNMPRYSSYAKANNRFIKYYDKNKELSCLKGLDADNLYGWAISQKLTLGDFKWVLEIFQFNENFIKV